VVSGTETALAVDAGTQPTVQIFDRETEVELKLLELIERSAVAGAYSILITSLAPLVPGRLYWFRVTAVVAAATIVGAETIRFEDNSEIEYIYKNTINQVETGLNPEGV